MNLEQPIKWIMCYASTTEVETSITSSLVSLLEAYLMSRRQIFLSHVPDILQSQPEIKKPSYSQSYLIKIGQGRKLTVCRKSGMMYTLSTSMNP